MLFFSKRKSEDKEKVEQLQKEVAHVVPKNEQHRQEVIWETTAAAAKFKDTIIENGFTIRIHKAAGGYDHGA